MKEWDYDDNDNREDDDYVADYDDQEDDEEDDALHLNLAPLPMCTKSTQDH